MRLQVICAWCGKEISPGETPATHGICESCYLEQLNDIEQLDCSDGGTAMADFCFECYEKRFGVSGANNDLKGRVPKGHAIQALCEGCGFGVFDHTGTRLRDEKPKQEENEHGNATRSTSG